MDIFELGRQVATRAKDSGALCSVPTRVFTHQERGLTFLIHLLDGPLHKPHARGQNHRDPFASPDPELLVAQYPHYSLLLNKFNVLSCHLLLITRDLHPQDGSLTEQDFAAFWPLLCAHGAIGFYNGGPDAGASQPHRHFQLLPGQFDTGLSGPPINPADADTRQLLSPHSVWLELSAGDDSHKVYAAYRLACRQLKLVPTDPFNLILLPEGLWVIPRSCRRVATEINALAFLGSLFAVDRQQLDDIRRSGVVNILRQASVPSQGGD
ncbi:DUF4922 domain-containing protein [Zobellella maritima]|uniref:DUF4922 domain-containing protein n=1 Tax=Zobellella maritima TaxID=2059725 RepID=UPI000E301C0A|nr:DUF4922 domain-containing protein [Zobellella maritima]